MSAEEKDLLTDIERRLIRPRKPKRRIALEALGYASLFVLLATVVALTEIALIKTIFHLIEWGI